MNLTGKNVLVVIPTCNEGGSVGQLIDALLKPSPGLHVLVVDDASFDGTRDAVTTRMKLYPRRVHMLARPRRHGFAQAYLDGFAWGLKKKYDTFVQIDADLSHPPELLRGFLRLSKKHSVVIGSRYIPGGGTEGWSWVRRCLSLFGNWYAKTILGIPLSDITSGYIVWQRPLLERILNCAPMRSVGFSFQIELKFRAVKAGAIPIELPILFRERIKGKSKISFNIIFEAILRVPLLLRVDWAKVLPPDETKKSKSRRSPTV